MTQAISKKDLIIEQVRASYSIYPLTPESVPCAPRTRNASKTSGSLRDRRLILPELGYRFTHEAANPIQKITRNRDWQADRASRPACA